MSEKTRRTKKNTRSAGANATSETETTTSSDSENLNSSELSSDTSTTSETFKNSNSRSFSDNDKPRYEKPFTDFSKLAKTLKNVKNNELTEINKIADGIATGLNPVKSESVEEMNEIKTLHAEQDENGPVFNVIRMIHTKHATIAIAASSRDIDDKEAEEIAKEAEEIELAPRRGSISEMKLRRGSNASLSDLRRASFLSLSNIKKALNGEESETIAKPKSVNFEPPLPRIIETNNEMKEILNNATRSDSTEKLPTLPRVLEEYKPRDDDGETKNEAARSLRSDTRSAVTEVSSGEPQTEQPASILSESPRDVETLNDSPRSLRSNNGEPATITEATTTTETDSETTDNPEKLPFKNILITGVAGFIGSHVVEFFVKKYKNNTFFGLDKLSYCSSIKNLNNIINEKNFKFIKADIRDKNFIEYILRNYEIDCIINFAAYTAVDMSFNDSLVYTENNVYGTHVLLECVRENRDKIKKFLHISTDEVYGCAEKHADETTLLAPTNPYSSSKAAQEMICYSYIKSFNIPITIIRMNNVFGERQYPEKIIPKFCKMLLDKKVLTIHGRGEVLRNFIYVGDVCRVFDILIQKSRKNEIYNIGSEFEISVLDLTKEIINIFKENIEINRNLFTKDQIDFLKRSAEQLYEFTDDRCFNDTRYLIKTDKITELGFIYDSSKEYFLKNLRNIIRWNIDCFNGDNNGWLISEN